MFVAEGRLAATRLLESAYPVVSLLVAEGKGAALPDLVRAVEQRGVPVYVAAPAVLARTVGFDLHRGVVALGRRLPPVPVDAVAAGPGPLLVAEGLNDHENLGALFRNAAALAAGGVVLDPTGADPLYRRSVRVSLGHVLHVPWARSADWPGDLRRLRAGGWRLLALTPGPGARPLPAVAPAGRTALLVGAEGPGLSAAALAAADEAVRIPMAPGVDSLNVATTAAVALYHLGLAGG
ncbi:MAG TPA: RNA methyltransferase [Acidimicrobiales bacterium]|nr:RNA methyltransferase [Acidimicrobiales bacterium]